MKNLMMNYLASFKKYDVYVEIAIQKTIEEVRTVTFCRKKTLWAGQGCVILLFFR